MLSRISNYGNTVKAQFEIASGRTSKKKIIRSSTGDDRRSSTGEEHDRRSSGSDDRRSSTDDDSSRRSSGSDEDTLQSLNKIYDHIETLYDISFDSEWSLSDDKCETLMEKFTELEDKYKVSKKVLIANKEHKETIKQWDSDISHMRQNILNYCSNTIVKDEKIENKLSEINNMINDVKKITDDNYGYGYGTMKKENCEEMKKCEPLIVNIEKELDIIKPLVKKNASMDYVNNLRGLETRCNALKTKLNYAKNRGACKDTFK